MDYRPTIAPVLSGRHVQDRMNDTLLHVLDSIAEEASGPSYSVPRLCDCLAEAGGNVTLLTLGETPRAGTPWRHAVHAPDFADVPVLGRLRFSGALRRALDTEARAAAIVHAHGLWLMPNVYPARAAAKAGRPLVVSPRGMLGPSALRFSARKKRAFWLLAQGKALRSAACIHATSGLEYDDVRAFGMRNPVAVIPNGIDVPITAEKPERREGEPNVALYLGRIHPKKGLDQLFAAWTALAEEIPDWRLDVVGPLDSDYARQQAARFGTERVRFVGPLYGAEKHRAYREADLFVMPTLNENFGMTVAEALAQGTPVICTKGAPWGGLPKEGCGWWIDHGAEPLAATLRHAMGLPRAERLAMGEAGRRWMAREFGWESVGRNMMAVYAWLTGAGPRPACVATD